MSSPTDDPLAHEHAQLRAEAAAGRKAFEKAPEARLGASVMEAVRLATKMKADGAFDAERFQVIEATLREFWPNTRVWRYLCKQCLDTGLVIQDGITNRLGCVVDEGYPCVCSKGKLFREKPLGGGDDYTKAGKVSKPKGFTRWGR